MSVRLEYVSDADLNDSSKIFTVPSGRVWVLSAIHVKLIATATVGSRRIRVIARDENDLIYAQIEAGVTVPASQTQEVDFFTGAPDSVAEVNDTIKVSLPVLVMLPGHDLVVEDGEAIDAAADDMTVNFTRQNRAV